VSQQKGSEILAVQTLRNSLMSATMTASSLHASFGQGGTVWPEFTPRLAMELGVLGLLFASLVS
jgi:hypothetical protein